MAPMAVLITYGVAVVLAVNYVAQGSDKCIPLDMALKSVDDMYIGCSEQMFNKIEKYLKGEMENNPNFSEAWNISDNNYWERNNPRPLLPTDESKAVYVYTLPKPEIYREFNNAVRTQKSEYKTTFRYHALHFLLTKALQTMAKCYTSYRRVNICFKKVALNKEFRFGSFTSSSLYKYPRLTFGFKSCFKITSCMGANITQYSKYPSENEVLIPPYEIFKVTKIEMRNKNNKHLPCEVVYTVETTMKSQSKLNCALCSHAVTKTGNLKFNIQNTFKGITTRFKKFLKKPNIVVG